MINIFSTLGEIFHPLYINLLLISIPLHPELINSLLVWIKHRSTNTSQHLNLGPMIIYQELHKDGNMIWKRIITWWKILLKCKRRRMTKMITWIKEEMITINTRLLIIINSMIKLYKRPQEFNKLIMMRMVIL